MPAPPDPALEFIELLGERLGHRFATSDLAALALTHRSWCAEHEGFESNERLEFLGDAVLGIVVTDHIYRNWPALAEGAMAKVRASVVSASSLASVAAALGMGQGLRLGKGEESTGGRSKPSILADALEAVLGAVYLDGGWPAARRTVLDLFEAQITDAASDPGTQDYKTRLQELVARRFDQPPGYVVEEEGPDHDKRFRARVLVGGVEVGAGEGRSKKQAQQAAAEVAWSALEDEAVAPGDVVRDASVAGVLVLGDPATPRDPAGQGLAGAVPPEGPAPTAGERLRAGPPVAEHGAPPG